MAITLPRVLSCCEAVSAIECLQTSASTEPASYRFTHTDTTAEKLSGCIVAVRGANTATRRIVVLE